VTPAGLVDQVGGHAGKCPYCAGFRDDAYKIVGHAVPLETDAEPADELTFPEQQFLDGEKVADFYPLDVVAEEIGKARDQNQVAGKQPVTSAGFFSRSIKPINFSSLLTIHCL
jgi:hypothetical protein